MALSNKFGWLLLTTGNKSELAVGYCTLYGDMCGGLAVISDVPKMMVYDLAHHLNRRAGRGDHSARARWSRLRRPSCARIRPIRTHCPPMTCSMPSWPDTSKQELVRRPRSSAAGFDEPTVQDVARKVDRNEYKRKQAATGLKVTSRAFGTGRRMPIAARYG
jgi:NAD+ synthase (glutamine-hydrolysing)